MKKVGVLFSAGIDSTTQIHMLQFKGFNVFPITFNDATARTRLKQDIAVEHLLYHFDLVMNHIEVRFMNREELRVPGSGLVPGMKLNMIMTALAYCQRYGLEELHLGYLKDDRYPYPDEGPDAFKKMTDLYNTMYGTNIQVVLSLSHMTKPEVITYAMENDVPLHMTFSCREVTVAGLTHCGKCDVCKMRYKAFQDAGYEDPAYYVTTKHLHEPLKGGQRLGYTSK